MKTIRAPIIVLLLLWLGLFLYLAQSGMSDRVASHFDNNGNANAWMERNNYLVFMGFVGFIIPLIAGGGLLAASAAVCLLSFLPVLIQKGSNGLKSLFRGEDIFRIFTFLTRQSLWFACFVVCSIATLHFFVIQANAATPAHLQIFRFVMISAIPLMLGTVLWLISLILHILKLHTSGR